MAKKKIQAVDLEESRYGLFMTENSFNLDVMYGREYLNKDVKQTVRIHRLDLIKTKSHSLYGQSKPSDKTFMMPIEISVMINVEETEQKYYGETKGGLTRDDTGVLSFGVYLKELEEKNVEINRGDIIEYNMSGKKSRYYEVESANNVTDVTGQTIAGFKSYWKKIVSVPVKEDVVPFLRETKGDFN